MNPTSDDIQQLIKLIDSLLLSVSVSSLILGGFIGWHFRAEYAFRQWLKRGVYCDDCAPLVDRSKEQGGK